MLPIGVSYPRDRNLCVGAFAARTNLVARPPHCLERNGVYAGRYTH